MKTAIVISSCDLYKDCWEPMLKSFDLFWQDCPYPIYFVSNYYSVKKENVNFIKVGEHKGFCSNLKKALNQIDADNIILFLEDFFLDRKVSSKKIENHIKHFHSSKIDYLKIDASDVILRDNLRVDNSIYCNNPLNIKYSLNACIAIWKRRSLISICPNGYTAWDFERNGISYKNKHNISLISQTLHSSAHDSEYIKKIAPPGAVSKGRWTKEGVNYLRKNNYEHLLEKRDIEGYLIRLLVSFYRPSSIFWLPFGLLLRLINKLKINI